MRVKLSLEIFKESINRRFFFSSFAEYKVKQKVILYNHKLRRRTSKHCNY